MVHSLPVWRRTYLERQAFLPSQRNAIGVCLWSHFDTHKVEVSSPLCIVPWTVQLWIKLLRFPRWVPRKHKSGNQVLRTSTWKNWQTCCNLRLTNPKSHWRTQGGDLGGGRQNALNSHGFFPKCLFIAYLYCESFLCRVKFAVSLSTPAATHGEVHLAEKRRFLILPVSYTPKKRETGQRATYCPAKLDNPLKGKPSKTPRFPTKRLMWSKFCGDGIDPFKILHRSAPWR